MIDTHCHIYLEQFENDLSEVLYRASEVGVEQVLMPAINFDSLPKMDRLAHQQIEFHKMAGIHPTEINDGASTTEEELLEYCSQPDIIAVGETGLDYYWSSEYKEKQKESLRLHCKVAKALDKPIVLHNRESTDDLLDIIEEEQDGTLSGVWHCFNGSVEEGKRALDLGLYLGIGGVLTFKNAGVDETVAQLPIEKMILETDAPYLSPEPNRGKRNEPAFVKYTAEKLGEVLNSSFEEIDQVTSSNARHLFGLSL
ncbi:TatD family hydrolase [Aliifodinibius sp. S!AR15-10]|uniref:TatD family hydrolase n=1 Tax=Aliifodinibius sp. S!AR15-10 TaxID=2950437 RepID=UPI00285DACA5|nr:TatD family hydrolase [Aliifodinibius sp. S!AR15-10]MDR8389760.1 TatD family hydrolase [Aliifodinibius sp. S!AR15-10]